MDFLRTHYDDDHWHAQRLATPAAAVAHLKIATPDVLGERGPALKAWMRTELILQPTAALLMATLGAWLALVAIGTIGAYAIANAPQHFFFALKGQPKGEQPGFATPAAVAAVLVVAGLAGPLLAERSPSRWATKVTRFTRIRLAVIFVCTWSVALGVALGANGGLVFAFWCAVTSVTAVATGMLSWQAIMVWRLWPRLVLEDPGIQSAPRHRHVAGESPEWQVPKERTAPWEPTRDTGPGSEPWEPTALSLYEHVARQVNEGEGRAIGGDRNRRHEYAALFMFASRTGLAS